MHFLPCGMAMILQDLRSVIWRIERKCPLEAQILEHLVPSWRFCLGRCRASREEALYGDECFERFTALNHLEFALYRACTWRCDLGFLFLPLRLQLVAMPFHSNGFLYLCNYRPQQILSSISSFGSLYFYHGYRKVVNKIDSMNKCHFK